MLTEVLVGRPDARLRPYVDRYLGYREHAALPLVRHEVAGAFVVLILGWGAPLDVTDRRAADRGVSGVNAFLAGPFDAHCTTRTVGEGAGVQLVLTLPAARRLLGMPLGEVANRVLPVDRVDDWLARLRDDLAELPDWPARFAHLDAALVRRLSVARPVDGRLRHAWRLVDGSGGAVEVAGLADQVGWSRRHLTAVFRREFGLPPKTVARLVRFQRAYATLGRGVPAATGGPAGAGGDGPGWAELAVRLGYCDQSHLIREFREYAGQTPAALRRSGSHSSNPC